MADARHLSTDYYQRLGRGRGADPSDALLDSISGASRLDTAEHRPASLESILLPAGRGHRRIRPVSPVLCLVCAYGGVQCREVLFCSAMPRKRCAACVIWSSEASTKTSSSRIWRVIVSPKSALTVIAAASWACVERS